MSGSRGLMVNSYAKVLLVVVMAMSAVPAKSQAVISSLRSLPEGSILFCGKNCAVSQNWENFLWENTRERLMVGIRGDIYSGYCSSGCLIESGDYWEEIKHPFSWRKTSSGPNLSVIGTTYEDTTGDVMIGNENVVVAMQAGTKPLAIAVLGDAYNKIGTTTWMRSFHSYIENTGGTTENAASFYSMSIVNYPGQTLQNVYGLYIEDQKAAQNNYAIKTGLGRVEFGDVVALGAQVTFTPITTPTACSAGQYFIYADKVSSKLRKCNNGVLSDL